MATFYNQATLSYDDTVATSNITTGEIIESLSATKTVLADDYSANELLTYVVSITNTSDLPITDVSISDNLGAYTFNMLTLVPLDYVTDSVFVFADGVLQPTPPVNAGPPLVISGLTVPANGNLMVIYSVRTNEYAPLNPGSEITNTVTISSASLCNSITAEETIEVSASPMLRITKSLSPTVVSEDDEITYTFVIENLGNAPADASYNASITDLFNPALSNISVVYNGTAWTEPANYTYNEMTGLFTTVPGQITVPAASYVQDSVTGVWTIIPGSSTLTVTGNI